MDILVNISDRNFSSGLDWKKALGRYSTCMEVELRSLTRTTLFLLSGECYSTAVMLANAVNKEWITSASLYARWKPMISEKQEKHGRKENHKSINNYTELFTRSAQRKKANTLTSFVKLLAKYEKVTTKLWAKETFVFRWRAFRLLFCSKHQSREIQKCFEI